MTNPEAVLNIRHRSVASAMLHAAEHDGRARRPRWPHCVGAPMLLLLRVPGVLRTFFGPVDAPGRQMAAVEFERLPGAGRRGARLCSLCPAAAGIHTGRLGLSFQSSHVRKECFELYPPPAYAPSTAAPTA